MTGAGTAADPYVIWDVNDLQDVGNGAPYGLGDYYQLGCNIDASATVGWNWDAVRGVFEGFDPVGIFTGHFDGMGFRISDLYINRDTGTQTGLFSQMTGAIIQHLWFESPVITAAAGGETGTLAGRASSCRVHDVQIYNPTMSSIGGRIGSLIGLAEGVATDLQYCISRIGSITQNTGSAGGLVGRIQLGTPHDIYVYRCAALDINVSVTSAEADVSGLFDSRGVVMNAYIHVDECFATGVIGLFGSTSIWSSVGGFAAQLMRTICQNCYSRVHVTWTGTNIRGAGGFCGVSLVNCEAHNCYSSEPITGAPSIGGFTGLLNAYAAQVACFWDEENSGVPVTSCNAVPLTTAQATMQATYTIAGWDFYGIWAIDPVFNDVYPYLLWGRPAITVVSPNGGEVWNPGSTYQILWGHQFYPGPNVRIELLKAGALDETIIASTPIGPVGAGTYAWTIGIAKIESNDYRIRITSTSTVTATDTSDKDFTIRSEYTPPGPSPRVATLPATGVR